MKRTLLKITAITLFTVAIAGVPALSRAQDTNAVPAAKAAADKINGLVTAVDTNAMTFTVGDQTFAVTSESLLTKNGKPAILADAVVGEPARGAYVTGSDGKLNATKVRFGKKAAAKTGTKKKKKAIITDTTSAPESSSPASPASPDTNAPATMPAN